MCQKCRFHTAACVPACAKGQEKWLRRTDEDWITWWDGVLVDAEEKVNGVVLGIDHLCEKDFSFYDSHRSVQARERCQNAMLELKKARGCLRLYLREK